MVTFRTECADDQHVWWIWVVGGLVAWFVVATAVALSLGKVIRLADVRSSAGKAARGDLAAVPAVRTRRRAIPLPAIGVALVALAVALQTSGFVTRLNGSTGSSAQLLSMDAPYSLPRMFVATVFAAAAIAAVAGAGVLPGRRTWWLAVGGVAGMIAAVKAGSTVHAAALSALGQAVGAWTAVLISAGIAAGVIGGLWFLSRHERRDRRRVLSVLALYAGASVGLSALSSVAAQTYGGASTWAAGMTFVEESGEAIAAVAFLIAVLAGVAPRLVLPGDWALRREADAHTLELPQQAPGRSTLRGPAAG